MPNKPWKEAERRIAKRLGTHRIALSGMAPFTKKGDIDLQGYVIDVKMGKQIPKKVTDWLEALRALEDDGIPVLILQPYRKKECIVILTLTDFERVRSSVGGFK